MQAKTHSTSLMSLSLGTGVDMAMKNDDEILPEPAEEQSGLLEEAYVAIMEAIMEAEDKQWQSIALGIIQSPENAVILRVILLPDGSLQVFFREVTQFVTPTSEKLLFNRYYHYHNCPPNHALRERLMQERFDGVDDADSERMFDEFVILYGR